VAEGGTHSLRGGLTANALGDSAIRIGFGDKNIYFLLLIVIKGLRIFHPVSLGRACFSGIRKASLSRAAYNGRLAPGLFAIG
jgi:hypothetical protein